MEKIDLTNKTFIGIDGTEYIVLVGYEDSEILFVEKANPNAELHFACDAKIENSRLYSSYKVSYTVSKDEFFNVIDSADPVNSLKKKYYKIPRIFLNLIVDMYFDKMR